MRNLVEVVDGSPAAAAGLAEGDTITAVDATPVTTAEALVEQVQAHGAGDAVTLAWTGSDGAAHSATATLAPGPVA